MSQQSHYWNKEILNWEQGVYQKKAGTLLEYFANKFRNVLVERFNFTVECLAPYIQGKTVLDLGCASGFLCYELLQKGAKKVIGVDLAQSALDNAQAYFQQHGVDPSQYTFLRLEVGAQETPLPKADITVGIGFIDYLNHEEMKKMFNSLSSPYFFFSFPEKIFSLREIIHILYRKITGCPTYKYSKDDFRKIVSGTQYTTCSFYQKGLIRIVHNVPTLS